MAFAKTIPLHPLLFVPDSPSSTPGCVVDADGMFPTASGARVLPSLVVQSNALPAPALGAFFAIYSQGGFNTFAGTGQHLYRLLNGVASQSGTGMTYDQFASLYKQYQNLPRLQYNSTFFQPPIPGFIPGLSWVEVDGGQTFSGQPWSFDQAGDDTIATNGADPVQVFSGSGTQFAPLAGNPPKAKFVVTVDPGAGVSVVTILANLLTDATGWVASAPGNDALWSLNVNDLSASGFLRAAPGPITGAKSVRTYAVLFKKDSMYLGTFVGPPYVWDFQPVSFQIGCSSNNAIINIGDLLVFPGPDDFYSFDGWSLNPIPNALREWFFGQPGQQGTGIANPMFLNKILARYDESTGVVYWHFSSVNANPAGTLDMYISWNKKSGRWLPGHTIIQMAPGGYGKSGLTYDQFCVQFANGANGGLTVDQLASIDPVTDWDSLLGGVVGKQTYAQLPHLTYADPSFGPASNRSQSVILPDGKLYTYTGPANSGYLQTGDLGDPIRLTRINRLRGQFGVFPARATNGQRALLSSFVRRNLGDVLVPFKTNVPLSDQGYFDFMESAGWHSLLMAFQSDAELQALSPDAIDAGDR